MCWPERTSWGNTGGRTCASKKGSTSSSGACNTSWPALSSMMSSASSRVAGEGCSTATTTVHYRRQTAGERQGSATKPEPMTSQQRFTLWLCWCIGTGGMSSTCSAAAAAAARLHNVRQCAQHGAELMCHGGIQTVGHFVRQQRIEGPDQHLPCKGRRRGERRQRPCGAARQMHTISAERSAPGASGGCSCAVEPAAHRRSRACAARLRCPGSLQSPAGTRASVCQGACFRVPTSWREVASVAAACLSTAAHE